MLSILKSNRRSTPQPRRPRVEVSDVTEPAAGSPTYLPFLHVPGEQRPRPSYRSVIASDQRSPTFQRDLERVLAIFSN